MPVLLSVHPVNPQPRLLRQATELLQSGAVLAVPTDTCYALVCQLDDKAAADTLRRIRQLDDKQHLSLLCRDLHELSSYARVDNAQFRLLKLGTPGPFAFILQASKEVPRRVSHPQRKTIGLRVAGHAVVQALIGLHGAPLLATTLILPGDTEPLNDPQAMPELLDDRVAAVIDAGACPGVPSTVIDLSHGGAELLRRGLGDPARLGL